MRLLAPALALLAFAAACPSWFAPPPRSGVSRGGFCSTDVECADGLLCACGQCASPDEDAPPSCTMTLDDACRTPPSECFETCGSDIVVGRAECVNGRETCADVGGVLRSQCPPDTCWGDAPPGAECVEGEWVCRLGESALDGLCYTDDCTGEPGECVDACDDNARYAQECIAGEYRCEVGFPVEQCGGCLGEPPPCLDGCDTLRQVATATCDDGAFSCSFILDAVVATECGCVEGPITVLTASDDDAHASTPCVLGEVFIQTTQPVDIELPALEAVSGSVRVLSSASRSARFPALARIGGDLYVQGNSSLVELELSSLERVEGDFVVQDNPELPACEVYATLARVQAAGGVGGTVAVQNNDPDPGLCADAGPELDAGLDGGGEDAAEDAGSAVDAGLDAGPDAGGDAGFADAAGDGGAAESGSLDGGSSDGGPRDGGPIG